MDISMAGEPATQQCVDIRELTRRFGELVAVPPAS
jgi:hypothetical protein